MTIKISGLLFFLSLSIFGNVNGQKNLTLLSKLNYSPASLAGVWHYSNNGKEYALVGTMDGISIVDVTNKITPQKLMQLPGAKSIWHEVKVWGDYAYAVSEGKDTVGGIMNGVQIINLSYLPDSAPNYFWQGDSIIAGRLLTAHTVTAEEGYLYINGHNIDTLGFKKGVLILDLKDPWNPHFIGAEKINYCHDSYVRGDTLWTSDFLAGGFSVFNIANRANPVLIQTQQTPSRANHNTALSDNGKYLYATDEKNGAPISSFDVSDLSNITLVDLYYTVNMRPAEGHNVRVLNDFIINSSYGSQVTLIDAKYPDNLIETGNYPTGTSLCWDADPYLPSGVILATDKNSGDFFILQPNYVRACYLIGNVTDSMTGSNLFNSQVTLQSTYVSDSTDLFGNYKTGYPDSGYYSIQFSKGGYQTKTISNVHLENGVQTVLDVQLVRDFTGLEETTYSNSLIISQNPLHQTLTVHLNKKLFTSHSDLQLRMSDASGRTIKTIGQIQTSVLELSSDHLIRGIYFIQLFSHNTQLASEKIVLQ